MLAMINNHGPKSGRIGAIQVNSPNETAQAYSLPAGGFIGAKFMVIPMRLAKERIQG